MHPCPDCRWPEVNNQSLVKFISFFFALDLKVKQTKKKHEKSAVFHIEPAAPSGHTTEYTYQQDYAYARQPNQAVRLARRPRADIRQDRRERNSQNRTGSRAALFYQQSRLE